MGVVAATAAAASGRGYGEGFLVMRALQQAMETGRVIGRIIGLGDILHSTSRPGAVAGNVLLLLLLPLLLPLPILASGWVRMSHSGRNRILHFLRLFFFFSSSDLVRELYWCWRRLDRTFYRRWVCELRIYMLGFVALVMIEQSRAPMIAAATPSLLRCLAAWLALWVDTVAHDSWFDDCSLVVVYFPYFLV